MAYAKYTIVTDHKGVRGVTETQKLQNHPDEIVVLLQNGQEIVVPFDQLTRRDNGTYYMSLSLEHLANQQLTADETVIPIVNEEAIVEKQWVETGRVRIARQVIEEEQAINDFLLKEEVEIERVPINQPINELIENRYEGETLIIPVIEEVLVVEKRLILKEELRVTRRKVQTPINQTVTLHKEDVTVEHISSNDR